MDMHQTALQKRIPPMNKNQGPFSSLPIITAPATLREAVRRKIMSMEKRSYTAWLSSLIALMVVSVSAFVGSCVYAWNAVVASGFIQYAVLVFSDIRALSFSKDLGLSLVESLPALDVALVLSAGLISAGAVLSFVRLFKVVRIRNTHNALGAGVSFV